MPESAPRVLLCGAAISTRHQVVKNPPINRKLAGKWVGFLPPYGTSRCQKSQTSTVSGQRRTYPSIPSQTSTVTGQRRAYPSIPSQTSILLCFTEFSCRAKNQTSLNSPERRVYSTFELVGGREAGWERAPAGRSVNCK